MPNPEQRIVKGPWQWWHNILRLCPIFIASSEGALLLPPEKRTTRTARIFPAEIATSKRGFCFFHQFSWKNKLVDKFVTIEKLQFGSLESALVSSMLKIVYSRCNCKRLFTGHLQMYESALDKLSWQILRSHFLSNLEQFLDALH